MAKIVQNNFGGGEISPVLFGRSDLQVYYKGCALVENFVISKEGTLRKRHGIKSLFSINASWDNIKIVPYKYDRTRAGFFTLCAYNGNVGVALYNKSGTLLSSATIVGVIDSTQGAPSVKEQVKSIQHKQIGDQVWISNGRFTRYIQVTNFSSISVYEWSQAAVPDAIPHDDTLADLSTHWSIVRDQSRSGRKIYYGIVAVKDSVNSETSKGETTWETTWGSGHYINIHATIKVTDKSKWSHIIFCKRSGGTYGEVTRSYMDDIPDNYLYTNGSSTETAYKWTDGKWYNAAEGTSGAVEVTVTHHRYTFRDENHTPGSAVYAQTNVLGNSFSSPLCVDCFQQRRVFANAESGGAAYPMSLWFSEVGNLDNFYADRPMEDSDAFSPTISSTGPAFIRWVVCYQENIILFTDGGLYSVGFSQTQGFSANTCRISKFSQVTCSPNIQPIVTDAGVVFVGSDEKTVYTAGFDLQENSLKPINRSVLVEHLTRTAKIVSISLQEFPDNLIIVTTDDGIICTFTFERNEEVYAWSHSSIDGCQILDAVALGSVTDGVNDRTQGDIIFIVKKGQTLYACALDSTHKDTIGGVESNVKATLVTLRPESQNATIVGAKKNIKDVIVKLYQTGGVSVRSEGGATQPLVPSKVTGLYTGDAKVMPRGFINEEGQLRLESDNASPCEILQIISSMEVEQ